MTQKSGTEDNQPSLDLTANDWLNRDPLQTCFQCEEECNYLFDDCRCWKCTRMTIEEVRGH